MPEFLNIELMYWEDFWDLVIRTAFNTLMVLILVRYFYYRRKLRYLGKNVKIDTGVYFSNPEYISIDENSWIDRNVSIIAGEDKSSREKIYRENKNFTGEPGTVTIGKNVHVSIGCILSGIGAGIHIGDNCGIAAGGRLYAFSHHYRSMEHPQIESWGWFSITSRQA